MSFRLLALAVTATGCLAVAVPAGATPGTHPCQGQLDTNCYVRTEPTWTHCDVYYEPQPGVYNCITFPHP